MQGGTRRSKVLSASQTGSSRRAIPCMRPAGQRALFLVVSLLSVAVPRVHGGHAHSFSDAQLGIRKRHNGPTYRTEEDAVSLSGPLHCAYTIRTHLQDGGVGGG